MQYGFGMINPCKLSEKIKRLPSWLRLFLVPVLFIVLPYSIHTLSRKFLHRHVPFILFDNKTNPLSTYCITGEIFNPD